VKLNQLVGLVVQALVGRFQGQKMSTKTLKEWLYQTRVRSLGYCPRFHLLVEGWMDFVLQPVENVEKILRKKRRWDFIVLIFKQWNPFFDVKLERSYIVLVWVKLPGLPMEFWLSNIFQKNGKAIGTFMEADITFMEMRVMTYVRTLVGLDIQDGLPKEMYIQRGPITHL
jgi:hypothetical protein